MDLVRWLLDTASNYAPHVAGAAAVLLGVMVYYRQWPAVLLFALLAVAGTAMLLRSEPYLLRPTGDAATGAAEERAPLRVLTANLLYSNRRFEELARFFGELEAHVVVLQEYPRDAPAELDAALAARFPHRLQDGDGWVRLYSTLPLEDARVHDVPTAEAGRDVLEATVTWEGRPVRVVTLHGLAPMSVEWDRVRRSQYRVAEHAAQGAGPVVVAGDFNATVLSPALQSLLAGAELRSVVAGRDAATYPLRLGPLGLRIDHVLVRGLRPVEVRLLTVPGSDHRAVEAWLLPDD